MKSRLLSFNQTSSNTHPVLFLHGFLEDSAMWNSLNVSKNDFSALFVDLNGHGTAIGEYVKINSIQQLAEEVKQSIDDLELSDYDIVGHSMGGYVAVELAKIDKRANKVVFLHSNHWEDTSEKKLNRERAAKVVKENFSLFLKTVIPNLFGRPVDFQNEVNELIHNASKMNPQTVIDCSIAMKNRLDNSNWIKENAERVYLIQGENDQTMFAKIAKKMWKGAKNNYFELKNCAHMGQFEQSTLVDAILAEILK